MRKGERGQAGPQKEEDSFPARLRLYPHGSSRHKKEKKGEKRGKGSDIGVSASPVPNSRSGQIPAQWSRGEKKKKRGKKKEGEE